ncbi:MAG: M1 family peptidase [Sphingobium sp.]|nr:M1 family peptidase [Sphingobium sp.]
MKVSPGSVGPLKRNKYYRAVAPVALALASLSAPALAQQQKASGDTATPQAPVAAPIRDVTTQLPRGVTPTHYAITVRPDAANLRFSGDVTISIIVAQPTASITLNAADISFRSAEVAPAIGKAMAGTVTVDKEAQTATVTFGKELAPGQYKLSFAYDGAISQQANGLFALDYKDTTGADKRALFTQFEAPDARRFVPSWDEPYYKATFDLSVIVPQGQMAVGNMPVRSTTAEKDGTTKVHFATTPRMSTYLLFLGMGELERKTAMSGTTELGVVTGKGNVEKAQFALDAAGEILPYFNDYFGTVYPLPKLDNVAGPGQSQFFSAMENWGAIFTFERAFLVDPKSTTEAARRRVYEITAHEMAHQWFGDLVTMAWWDDLWLNEGFASWMATKVTDKMKPEWDMLLTRVEGRERAMGLDAYTTTHPVVQQIKTVDEVTQAFDAITYQKGEAVISMLENFAGEDVWRNGIRAYIQGHAYGNTVTADFWSAIEQAGAKGLSGIAHDFTTKPGIPLVKVESAQCANGRTYITLSQGEFSRDAKEAKDAAPQSWHVPVKGQVVGGAEGQIVLNGTGRLELPGCGTYVVNSGQAGYYRTLYPKENVAALAKNFTKLAAIDQTGLLADNWELGLGGYQPVTRALDLIDAVPDSASDAVLAELPGYMQAAYGMFDGDEAMQRRFRAYGSAKLTPTLARIGLDAQSGEAAQAPLLRQNLLTALGDLGDEAVVAEARRRFNALDLNPAALDGPLKYVWLGIVAQHADKATWDRLRTMANDTQSAMDRAQAYTILGRAKDRVLAEEALKLALTDEPGKTTSAALVSAVAIEHDALAVDFVLKHMDVYEKLVGLATRNQMVARLGGGSGDLAMADKLNAYADQYQTAESRKVTDRAIAAVRARAATWARVKPEIAYWLDNRKTNRRAR